MKRHPALISLSQDHHHALVLCTRILRNPDQNHAVEIQAYRKELLLHFQEEETGFEPFWARLPSPDLKARFDRDHAQLRAMLAEPEFDSPQWNRLFATTLRDHARFEERILFEEITRHCLSENP